MAEIGGPLWEGKRYDFAIPDRIEFVAPIGMALTGEPEDDADRLRMIRLGADAIVEICERIEGES